MDEMDFDNNYDYPNDLEKDEVKHPGLHALVISNTLSQGFA